MTSRRPPFWVLGALAVLGILVFSPSRATAASPTAGGTTSSDRGVSVTDVQRTGDQVGLALRLRPQPGDTDPHVEIRYGGIVLTTSQKVTDTVGGEARTAVLVVDTSGSMKREGIRAARAAAHRFAATAATDVRIGLVAFSDRARVLTSPTTDRADLDRGLGQLEAAGETALYDAVRLGVRTAGRNGSVVVLSDGGDTVSTATLGEATSAVRAANVSLDVVAFTTKETHIAALDALTAAGNGRVVKAEDAATLADALADAARAIPSSLTVTAELPDTVAPDGPVVLDISVTTGSRTAALRVDVPVAGTGSGETGSDPDADPGAAGAPGAAPATAGATVDAAARSAMDAATSTVRAPGMPFWAVGLGTFALLCLTVLVLWPRPQTAAERRRRALDAYTLVAGQTPAAGGQAPTAEFGDDGSAASSSGLSAASGGILRVSQRYVASGGREARIALALDRAGLAMKPSEWVVIKCCAAVATAAVLGLLSRHLVIGALLGLVAAWVASNAWLRRRQAQRSAAFADQLPDTLQVVASSLRSGFSLNQALAAAHERGIEPMASELGRALAAARIGANLEDELDAVATRMGSEDWRWAVMAIRIQRNVGGNLAEILLTTARTLRERAAMGRQVRTLSAEGRLSAYVLIALPVFMSAFMVLFRRSYVEPLWTTAPGIAMLIFAVGGIALGWVWMRKMIEVRV